MPPAPEPSDATLLATIAAGDDRAAVRAAQRELYGRHIRYLYGTLYRQRDKLLRLAGVSADDLVQDTFQRAFEKAHTFRADPDLDPDRARRRTRAWLGRIAQNLLTDAFRRVREVAASDYLESIPEPEAPGSRPDLAPIEAALAELSDREQDILRVTALFHRVEGHGRLPNDVSAELAERWGITNDNVRAIRSRAMKKLRRALTPQQEAR